MRLSHDKILHLSHLITNALDDSELVTRHIDKNILRTKIATIMLDDLSMEDQVEQDVRRILHSYKRKIVEGTREWDIMYQKLFEEQMNKRGKIR